MKCVRQPTGAMNQIITIKHTPRSASIFMVLLTLLFHSLYADIAEYFYYL